MGKLYTQDGRWEEADWSGFYSVHSPNVYTDRKRILTSPSSPSQPPLGSFRAVY